MKSFFSSLLGATLFVILLFFPGLVFEGAKMGLNLWFFTLVPTLLPFMVFSNILIQSRLIEHLLFLPGLFTRKYLHLSPAGLYAFLCGFFFRLSFRCQNSCRSFKNRSDRSKGSFHALRFLQQRKSGFSYHLFSDTALKTPGESRDHRLFSVHNTCFCLSDGIFLLRQFLFSP